ncbi:Feline leukemia virus subgroup C receptor-related protein 1 [Seminavis robusta]|uniref:Feline leukemia virus subgroup C receptor-related protein 1 n=1 Tax=Seminavis robusta TaxID=568900 RepID=A0A9N8HQG2_9STRA|nr:Feline leukemia virus subgroup C receptor-related protein 1 [Seminavis robusta]|eukprot:Sro1285_g259290.1 Feline leukemia virus subgroup C receptor-related protein 1 (524) ;mRNA; r:6379-7950
MAESNISIEDGTMRVLTEPLLKTEETASTQSNHSDDNDEEELHHDQEYILVEDHYCELDPKRFVVLCVFSLNNLLPSTFWITFAPIQDAVQVKFNITAQQVNWLSLIFMLLYGPATALCAYTIRTVGLRHTVVGNSILMAVGSLLRWWSCCWIMTDGSNNCFAYVLLLTGQGIVAAGQPVFANAPARVASSWFEQTTQPIAVVSIAASIGMVMGQAMSPLLVEESTGAHLDQLLLGQAVAMVACTIATWYWFDEMPAIPPTPAEAARRRQQQPSTTTSSSSSMTQDIWKLLTDRQYIVLTAAFGIIYGVGNATMTITQPWIASAGFPGDKTAGLCGSCSIVGGLIGMMIAAPWLDYTQNYNQAVRVTSVVSFLTAVATVACLQPNCPVWLLAAAFTAMGMAQMPLLPICIDAAAAHSYPMPEELSSAGLQLVGQYLGIVLVDMLEPMIQRQQHNGAAVGFAAPVNILLLSLVGISTAMGLTYQGKNPRATANNQAAAANHDITNAAGEGEIVGADEEIQNETS